MRGAVTQDRWWAADHFWGYTVFLIHMLLFGSAAATAWASTINGLAVAALAALPVTFVLGLLMLLDKGARGAGLWLLAATVAAAVVEGVGTMLLVVAYSNANPGWELS